MQLEDVKNIAVWADIMSHEYAIAINIIVTKFVEAHKETKHIEKAKEVVELCLQEGR